jgi:predicted sulfurtransferase
MKRNLKKFLPLAIMLSMLTWGCVQTEKTADPMTKSTAAMKQEATVYKGKIAGKSKKAKTISIVVGKGDKAKTIMVKFDNKTKGLDFAKKGEAAIINWEMRGSDKYATVIKQKLAKLPEGVLEVKPKEVKALLDKDTDLVLIDSRPEKRFAQSHLPGAISITVNKMKASAHKLLPPEKDKLLVFYCGGYT